MITLLTAGGILIPCAAMIIWDKIRQRKWFLRHLKQRWGTVPDREYTQEELESISHYAKRNEGEQFMIDDTTWNDLQMDEIFIRINNTLSSCGEDVLYQILRQPQMDRNVLDERERLIAYFQTHEEERIQVLTRVNEVKKDLENVYCGLYRCIERCGSQRKRKILSACRTFGSGNCRYADSPDPVYVSVASDALRQCGGSYTGFQKD